MAAKITETKPKEQGGRGVNGRWVGKIQSDALPWASCGVNQVNSV